MPTLDQLPGLLEYLVGTVRLKSWHGRDLQGELSTGLSCSWTVAADTGTPDHTCVPCWSHFQGSHHSLMWPKPPSCA